MQGFHNSRTNSEHTNCCKNTTKLSGIFAENKGLYLAILLDFCAEIC